MIDAICIVMGVALFPGQPPPRQAQPCSLTQLPALCFEAESRGGSVRYEDPDHPDEEHGAIDCPPPRQAY